MKVLYRRQRQQYLFTAFLGVIAVVNLLFFLILYNPARSEYYTLQESIQKMRTNVRTRQQSVARLEKLSAQLETSEQDRSRLFMMHFIAREAGFSEILPQLDMMAERAGVRKTRVDYSIDDKPQYGLYSVKIRIPVTGGYSNVVNFIKDLENSSTFFIIDSIDVRGNSTAAPGGVVSLGLNLETFFYQ